MDDITMDTARKEAEEMKKKEAERKAKKDAEKAAKQAAKQAEKAAKPKKEPVFDNITDEKAYKEAQAMKAKEAERKAASGGSSFWDRIKGNMNGTSGGAGHATDTPVPAPSVSPAKDTIANSIEAQANAKPGDVVNGKTLTQGDIDWAKKQMGTAGAPADVAPDVPEDAAASTTEAGNTEDVSTAEAEGIEGSNIASPEIEEARPSLDSPEVQKAIGAGGAEIEDAEGDEAKQNSFKQKYCNAIWENYDLGMSKQPKFKPGWQLPATILSIGLSVFSGGLVPPVNFMKLTGKEDEYNAAMDMWKETMDKSGEIAQEQERSSTMPTAKAEGMEAAKGTATQEAIDQAAEVNAAESGAQANARLGTEGELETMAKQAEIDYTKLGIEQANKLAQMKLEQTNAENFARLNTDLQKDIAEQAAALQIEIADAAAQNDLAKIQKLYTQTVNQRKDEMKALGYDTTPDGFLKFMRNTGGTSNALARTEAALKALDTAGNVAGTVINAVNPLK